MDEVTRRNALKVTAAGVALGAAGLGASIAGAQDQQKSGQDPKTGDAKDESRRKQELKTAEPLVRTWHAFTVSSAQAAASLANAQPPQGPGEVSITANPSGSYNVFLYF